MDNTYKTLCIVNPVSANGRTRKNWPLIEAFLKKLGLEFTVAYTTHAGDAIKIAQNGLAQGYNRLVAVGGDGTLHEVINGLYSEKDKDETDAVLSFIPMGTGGDFARMFSLSANPQEVYKMLTAGREHSIDIALGTYTNWEGERESRYFINVADIGIGSHTVYHVNRNSKVFGGFWSFLLAGLYSLLTYKSQNLTIRLDGVDIYQGKSNMVVISNGSYFGGGMKIAPHAQLDDGLLNITIVKNLNKYELLKHLPGIYSGKHITEPKIDFLLGKKVEITSTEDLLIEFDGETPGMGDLQIEIVPQALKLII